MATLVAITGSSGEGSRRDADEGCSWVHVWEHQGMLALCAGDGSTIGTQQSWTIEATWCVSWCVSCSVLHLSLITLMHPYHAL